MPDSKDGRDKQTDKESQNNLDKVSSDDGSIWLDDKRPRKQRSKKQTKTPETFQSDYFQANKDIAEAGRLIGAFFLTLRKIIGATSRKPLTALRFFFRVLAKILELIGRGVVMLGKMVGRAFLLLGSLIGLLLRFVHKPLYLILGLTAVGKPAGILLSTLFATVVTTFLYWGVNTYVFNYDHCFEYHKADDSVKFQSVVDPSSPNVFRTVSSTEEAASYSITINDEKENGCVYQVAKNDEPLFSVNMERVDDSLLLRVFRSNSKEESDEVHWHNTNNIASTNEVLCVRKMNRAIKYPVFPTNTGAFVSWLREYGKKLIPELKDKSVSDADLDLAIAGELERHLENEWYFNDKTYWFLIFGRSFNGTIQFFSVVFFVAALLCLYARNILFVRHLTAKKGRIHLASGDQLPFCRDEAVKESDLRTWLQLEYGSTLQAQSRFRKAWGCDSPQLFVWEHGLLQCLEPDSPHVSTFSDIGNVQKENLDNSRSFVYWLLESIPALGFVGTVIGISQTMMNTSSVLSSELGKQQSRISEVSMNLAFAFDTTLVALVLSLIASFFTAYCVRKENDALSKTQELLVQVLNENG